MAVSDEVKEDIKAAHDRLEQKVDDQWNELVWELAVKHKLTEEQVWEIIDA